MDFSSSKLSNVMKRNDELNGVIKQLKIESLFFPTINVLKVRNENYFLSLNKWEGEKWTLSNHFNFWRENVQISIAKVK
jgi:hypothetical protein